jgi:hypothetical protein
MEGWYVSWDEILFYAGLALMFLAAALPPL